MDAPAGNSKTGAHAGAHAYGNKVVAGVALVKEKPPCKAAGKKIT
jgi:hypothetical protein